MPRRPSASPAATVDAIVRRFLAETSRYVREEVERRVARETARTRHAARASSRPAARPAPLPPEPASPTVGGVRVRRLKPGPRPDAPCRSGPAMECRVPGCTFRSRGPRYDFFCGEHWRTLSEEQRREAAEQWKAARQQAAAAPRPPATPSVFLRRGQERRPVEPRPEPVAGEPAASVAEAGGTTDA